MIFKLHIPNPPLNDFVENIIYYSGLCVPHTKEKLLPDGYVELIIDLTETPKHVYDNEDHQSTRAYRKGWLSGIRREFITIEVAHNSSMMVARFKPGRALPFFGRPLNEFAGQVTEMDCVWGHRFESLREEILESESPGQRIAVLERGLLRIAESSLEINPAIDHALSLLSGPLDLTIAELRQRLGFSHRHLVHLFDKHVGISPKFFSRLLKFQKVLHALERDEKVSWTGVAHDSGYYDQAHFINEFRKFSGLAPAAYLTEKGEYLNYIPVA